MKFNKTRTAEKAFLYSMKSQIMINCAFSWHNCSITHVRYQTTKTQLFPSNSSLRNEIFLFLPENYFFLSGFITNNVNAKDCTSFFRTENKTLWKFRAKKWQQKLLIELKLRRRRWDSRPYKVLQRGFKTVGRLKFCERRFKTVGRLKFWQRKFDFRPVSNCKQILIEFGK